MLILFWCFSRRVSFPFKCGNAIFQWSRSSVISVMLIPHRDYDFSKLVNLCPVKKVSLILIPDSCYSRYIQITKSTYVIPRRPSKRNLLQRIKGTQRAYGSFKEKKSSCLHLKINKSVFWQCHHQPVYKITNPRLVDIGCQWLPIIYQ